MCVRLQAVQTPVVSRVAGHYFEHRYEENAATHSSAGGFNLRLSTEQGHRKESEDEVQQAARRQRASLNEAGECGHVWAAAGGRDPRRPQQSVT